MTSLNISLPEPMRAWIDEKVARGGYATPSELVRELIREAQGRDIPPSQPMASESEARVSTGASLLKFAGTWEGNDLEECLELAIATRSPVEP
jgi:antitoxin ParD1/3/4